MKFLTIFLAFVVVWLSVAPQSAELCQKSMASAETSCCDGGHCATTETGQSGKADDTHKGTNDCCPGGICSPFQTCAGCSIIKVEGFQLPAPLVSLIQKEKVRSAYTVPVSHFIGDFFQPPEWII